MYRTALTPVMETAKTITIIGDQSVIEVLKLKLKSFSLVGVEWIGSIRFVVFSV